MSIYKGNDGSKTTTQIIFSGVVNDNGYATWEVKGMSAQ